MPFTFNLHRYTPELIWGLCMDDRPVVSKEVKAAAAIALGMLMFHGGVGSG